MESKRPRGRPKKPADEIHSEKFEVPAPRKPISALTFYMVDYKNKFTEKIFDITRDSFKRQVSENWGKLTSAAKKMYMEKADKDIERYERQMKEFLDSGVYYTETGSIAYPPRLLKRKSSNHDKAEENESTKRKAILSPGKYKN